jgi:hypothetical protein
MRTTIMTVCIAVALLACPLAQTTQVERETGSLERVFTDAGLIRMDLGAGEYRITSSQGNRIRLDWSVKHPEDLSKVRAKADVHGREAVITTEGPHDGFKVAIRLPARADLHIWLTAGEIHIEGVQGSKDVQSHAGEIWIDVGRPEDYSRVHASVWAGEIHAAPFHGQKEGLFRSFDWTGKGPYQLLAKLKAGELHFYSKGTPEDDR